MHLVFAIFCLACAGVNDLVFKMYARKTRSRGAYIMVIGITWVTLLTLSLDFDFALWRTTLFWGVVSGLFSVVANILLIESMSHLEAGVSSTIYRLNLVPVVIGALIIFGEGLTICKSVGVLLAITAVLLFFQSSESNHGQRTVYSLGLSMVIVAAFFRAGMGLSYKQAFLHGADRSGLIVVNGALWAFGGLIYWLSRERQVKKIDKKPLLYGLMSGVLICGIVLFMALALQLGDAGVVLPIAQMSFLLTCILGYFTLGEKISGRKALGIAAGLLCILTFSLEQWLR